MNELTSFSLVGFNPWKDNLLTITFLNFRPLNDSVLLGLGFLYFPHPYLRLSKFALNLEIGSGPISTEPGGTSFQTTGLYWAREPVLMVTGFVGDVSGDVHWLLGSDLVFTDKLDTGRLLLCGWCCLRLSGSGYPSLSGGFLFLPGICVLVAHLGENLPPICRVLVWLLLFVDLPISSTAHPTSPLAPLGLWLPVHELLVALDLVV